MPVVIKHDILPVQYGLLTLSRRRVSLLDPHFVDKAMRWCSSRCSTFIRWLVIDLTNTLKPFRASFACFLRSGAVMWWQWVCSLGMWVLASLRKQAMSLFFAVATMSVQTICSASGISCAHREFFHNPMSKPWIQKLLVKIIMKEGPSSQLSKYWPPVATILKSIRYEHNLWGEQLVTSLYIFPNILQHLLFQRIWGILRTKMSMREDLTCI